MKTMLVTLSAAVMLMALTGLADAGTKLTADRNTEADMANYKIYACMTKGCVPTKLAALLKATIPQVPVGQIPQWVYPVNTEGAGCFTAVDLSGNESGCSNVANFDGAAPATPQNAQDQ